MKRTLHILAVFVLVLVISAGVFFYSTIKSPVHESDAYKDYLKYFQTYTIDVRFASPDLQSVYNKSEEDIGKIVLKRFSTLFENKFGAGKINSSKFGHPYSFQTNPLNLKIIFQVYPPNKHDADPFFVGAYFERSHFFALLATSLATEKEGSEYANYARRKYLDMLEKKQGNFIEPTNSRGFSREKGTYGRKLTNDEKSFFEQIDELCEVIVSEMEPKENEAAKLEAKLMK